MAATTRHGEKRPTTGSNNLLIIETRHQLVPQNGDKMRTFGSTNSRSLSNRRWSRRIVTQPATRLQALQRNWFSRILTSPCRSKEKPKQSESVALAQCSRSARPKMDQLGFEPKDLPMKAHRATAALKTAQIHTQTDHSLDESGPNSKLRWSKPLGQRLTLVQW